METIILRDGSTRRGHVENQGFDGLFWRGEYWENGFRHIVTYHGNTWME